MSKCYVIAVDGTDASIRTAQLALTEALEAKASIKVIHVLEWSPYSFLTTEEINERHKRRGEELARAKTAIIEPVLQALDSENVDVDSEVRYGNVAEVIQEYCKENNADHVFVSRQNGSGINARIFGTVPGTLIQILDIPVTVVP